MNKPLVSRTKIFCGGLFFILFIGACAGMQARDELQETVAKHHIDLRWGRFEKASQSVTPELRNAFAAEWTAKTTRLELQEIEVTGMQINDAADAADVYIVVTWIDRASMQVQTTQVQEHWVRVGTTWMADKPAEL